MNWKSAVALYVLFWVMSAFVVLPFGVRTHDEAGATRIPGQAESAPFEFRPSKIIVRTTLVATILFALFFANFVNGWISPAMLDVFSPKA